MKTSDINALKGRIKDGILKWSESMIDQMLPNRVAARAMLKNMAGNMLARFDAQINRGIDTAFLMIGDADGNIDSDAAVDMVCELLKEMPATDYALGALGATIGKGEIRVQFPRGVFSDLIVGNLDGVKITTADIQQIKTLII